VNHYVRKGESIMESDVVLWLSTACHHEPRSEDGEFQGKSFRGATLVAWSGFELRPRNVFDRTPHYNYPPPKK
jgi:Cu2+-containing amine oxidase